MDAADPERLFAACAEALLPAGAPLLLAVSGGSDSMALLAAAARWDRTRVAVAHVHHGLRPSADGDARLVRDVCLGLDVPCEVVHAPPAEDDAGRSGRSETASRSRRMSALTEVARRRGAPWVATAHHRDDAHETLLLHLQRGHRGDRALASIPTVRSLDRRVLLMRPFLYRGPIPGVGKPSGGVSSVGFRELAAYRERIGLPHREDPTNRDRSIPRNAIRHTLAAGEPPLDRDTLERVREAARDRLERRLGSMASRLESTWRAEGGGCVVDREAWLPPSGDTAQAWVPEVLRLVGAGLARSRVLAPRASVVPEIGRLLERGAGRLSVPASPGALEFTASRTGLHLPDEPLAEETAAARVLGALGRTSLHV